MDSFPGQNGQAGCGPRSARARPKACGRCARSVAMITQRPRMGSLRNSGMFASHRFDSNPHRYEKAYQSGVIVMADPRDSPRDRYQIQPPPLERMR